MTYIKPKSPQEGIAQMEAETVKLAVNLDLDPNTSREQIATLLKSYDLEINQESLRIQLIDKLRVFLIKYNLLGEALTNCIGKPNLSDETTWAEIDKIVTGIIERSFYGSDIVIAQDELTLALGFPKESYLEMIKCLDQGVRLEQGITLAKHG